MGVGAGMEVGGGVGVGVGVGATGAEIGAGPTLPPPPLHAETLGASASAPFAEFNSR